MSKSQDKKYVKEDSKQYGDEEEGEEEYDEEYEEEQQDNDGEEYQQDSPKAATNQTKKWVDLITE